MTLKNDSKFEEELTCRFEIGHEEFDKFWPEHSEVLKLCTLMDFLWTKYKMFDLKKRGYLSLHWRVIKKLKKNWLVVWKMTQGIWQIFTRALESLKIWTLKGSFYSKEKIYEIKIYRSVMCHDNEEWCKIWRGIEMLFLNWHMRNLIRFEASTRKFKKFAL